MSHNFLRSYEDLTGYLEVLEDHYQSFLHSLSEIPTSSEEPEEILKDVLSHHVSTQRKALEVTKLAKKFYRIQDDLKTNSKNLITQISSLQEELSHYHSRFAFQEKEIESKNKRLDDIELELQVTEKDYRTSLQQIERLKKENQSLKERPPAVARQRTSLLKQHEDNEEEIKNLKITIEDLREEIEKKNAEIGHQSNRVKEALLCANNERAAADKSKNFANSLKDELKDLKCSLDDLTSELKLEKQKSLDLEQELIKQKNHLEHLVKEYEKEKFCHSVSRRVSIESSGINDYDSRRAETLDSDLGISTFARRISRVEKLSDWINEEDEYQETSSNNSFQSKPFFVLTTPKSTFPFFNFREKNGLEIEACQKISVFSKTECVVEASVASQFATWTRTQNFCVVRQRGIKVLPSYPFTHPHSLKIVKNNNPDPMRTFFVLTCQSLDLNHKVGSIPIKFWYSKVSEIPFNKWYSYLYSQLLSN